MSLKLGNTDLNALNLGGVEINKAYLGAIEVFSGIETDFVSLWETTGASETIQLPVTNLYTIDWGDSNITTTETSHEYLVAGQYTISSPDAITDFAFNNGGDKSKILNVSSFGVGWMFAGSTFWGCSNLDITSLEVITVINGIGTFRGCDSLIWNDSISNANMSGTLSNLFKDSIVFNQPLFSLVNATVIAAMLSGCAAYNQQIPGDTENVTRMDKFLLGATAFNQPLNHLNYSNVTRIDDFMTGKTAADYTATNYDALLQKWDNITGGLVFGSMTNVNIGMGTIKRTAAGSTAHASLISKGFIITDGGI